jgi:hypothetical protein
VAAKKIMQQMHLQPISRLSCWFGAGFSIPDAGFQRSGTSTNFVGFSNRVLDHKNAAAHAATSTPSRVGFLAWSAYSLGFPPISGIQTCLVRPIH